MKLEHIPSVKVNKILKADQVDHEAKINHLSESDKSDKSDKSHV